jgi:small subunit ribosomal protein S7
MGRKKKSIDRGHQPDTKYNSITVTKFVCRMMWQGKKSICMGIMYDALDTLQKKANTPALDVFNKAMENVKPAIEVKSRRVGGATYQVPVEIRESRREALAMRWIIVASRSRTGKAMSDKLADELFDAFNNTGTSIKKKEEMHKMAEANKAFAHYRW